MSGGVGQPRLVFVAANASIDRLYEVDHLRLGSIHRPAVVVARPGGKGLNAARAAASLGARVTAVGIVGGRSGYWIFERLADIGVEASMLRSAGETRTCISILDRSTGSLTELYELGEELEPAAWESFEAIVAGELDRGDVGALAFSGSLPPGAPTSTLDSSTNGTPGSGLGLAFAALAVVAFATLGLTLRISSRRASR
jgi:fructose-1-phosphate kinase PfkB-like protein